MAPKLSNLIDRHRRYYESYEKQSFDKARRYYRGDFWYQSETLLTTDSTRNMLCSKNLIYAITDTAISALLGPNPKVAANPRNPNSEEATPAVNGLIDYIFETNNIRRRAATALIDSVLCKRGIFKTGWDMRADRPVVKVVDPAALFFDLTVRDVDDIRYWLEATVLPFEEFKRRVETGQYKDVDLSQVQPDRYPAWILGGQSGDQSDRVRDAFQWITVWEYYDREENIVMHYIRQSDKVLFKAEIDYIPYSMFSLNQSGVDCLGLSEVQLVLNQQETVNDLLTHMKQITYLMIPRILYDSGRISEEDLNKAVEASTGSFIGINPENSEALRTLATLFYEMPMPQSPEGVKEFTERQEEDAAFISALAEAARGQVTGARTATEMAIVDAQMRTRLTTRKGHVDSALTDVAAKAFYLCKKYMKSEKMVKVAGSKRWAAINIATIKDVEMAFSLVSYNPMQQNPAILAETLVQMLPYLTQDPNVDVRRLTEEVVRGLGFPNSILLTEQEAIDKVAAETELAQQTALGGAAAPAGPAPEGAPAEGAILKSIPPEIAEMMRMSGITPGESGLPPEQEIDLFEKALIAANAETPAPEQSLAAGGGAPIRGA
jgi:hypothetical protein